MEKMLVVGRYVYPGRGGGGILSFVRILSFLVILKADRAVHTKC